ncbi:MAG: PD-(D/E)XK nuclease domain-containing protein, partial [Mariprofundales bacterium]|nr:PD-(D/E)XK nuclease domain-containing protein [Mariprofundales bacterium]
ARALYMQADIAPLCKMLQQGVFEAFSNRDYRWSDELTVKTAFLATLFNDVLFIMDSEPELNRGYADLSMIVRPDMRHYDIFDILMEFKFIKLSDIGMTGEAIGNTSDEALNALPQVEKSFADAEQQLRRYIPSILKKHGDGIKLCSFAVVAVGFDRLLWKMVVTAQIASDFADSEAKKRSLLL